MGWIEELFNPGKAYERKRQEVQDRHNRQLEEGLARGGVHWVVWKYVRDQPFESGALSFYDGMSGLRKGLESGEIAREDVFKILDLEEN